MHTVLSSMQVRNIVQILEPPWHIRHNVPMAPVDVGGVCIMKGYKEGATVCGIMEWTDADLRSVVLTVAIHKTCGASGFFSLAYHVHQRNPRFVKDCAPVEVISGGQSCTGPTGAVRVLRVTRTPVSNCTGKP